MSASRPRKVRRLLGASQTVITRVRTAPSTARTPTGKRMRLRLMPERGQGNDFAVHGHAAKAQQHADQNGHGYGEDQDAGDNAKEENGDLRTRAGVTDKQLHEPYELGNEEHKCENDESQEGVTYHFADDVAV